MSARFLTLGPMLALAFANGPRPLPGQQPIDTARVRSAFEAVTALRADDERKHGHFVTVNGIRMHYLEWGDERGVPLIYAHGSAGSAYEIRSVAPRLVAAGYRVIAPDYRGHGLTRVTDFDFSIHHVADDFIALLDSLRIPRAVFGGSSKGGFIAAAVYDEAPDRVLGLLMLDGGTWSNQWMFDHQDPLVWKQPLERSGGPPRITGASELDVFTQLGGRRITAGNVPPEAMLETLAGIAQRTDGRWAYLGDFERLMGSVETYLAASSKPTTLPLLQWSQHAMIPAVVFRKLHVPMIIVDPQNENDDLPVTDQNAALTKQHPSLIVHRIYPQSLHAVIRNRPDWVIRDATELLARVRATSPR